MREKITVGKIWGIIYPILLYVLISVVVTVILEIALSVVVSVNGKATGTYEILKIVTGGLAKQTILLTLCVDIATIPVMVYLRYRDIQREKLNNRLKKYKKVFFLKYLFIVPFGFFSMMAASCFVNILAVIMPQFMIDSYSSTEQAFNESSIAMLIITAGIVGPIVEELIFRGLIYNRIKKISAVIPAAIISSLLFGVYHGNWIQGPFAFIIGMVGVYVYEKYKTLAAPTLLHMSANLLSVVLSTMATGVETEETVVEISKLQQISVNLVVTIVMGALAVAFGLLIQKTVKPKEIRE